MMLKHWEGRIGWLIVALMIGNGCATTGKNQNETQKPNTEVTSQQMATLVDTTKKEEEKPQEGVEQEETISVISDTLTARIYLSYRSHNILLNSVNLYVIDSGDTRYYCVEGVCHEGNGIYRDKGIGNWVFPRGSEVYMVINGKRIARGEERYIALSNISESVRVFFRSKRSIRPPNGFELFGGVRYIDVRFSPYCKIYSRNEVVYDGECRDISLMPIDGYTVKISNRNMINLTGDVYISPAKVSLTQTGRKTVTVNLQWNIGGRIIRLKSKTFSIRIKRRVSASNIADKLDEEGKREFYLMPGGEIGGEGNDSFYCYPPCKSKGNGWHNSGRKPCRCVLEE